MPSFILLSVFVCFFLSGAMDKAFALDRVGKYDVYEIALAADKQIENPFDVYLLKIELESPSGRKVQLDGFYDGDGFGGQEGRVWKARICPDEIGIWHWQAIPGDRADIGFRKRMGRFECIKSSYSGGLVGKGKYFSCREGGYVFLQGNFLDFWEDLPSTHVFMSHEVTDTERAAILERQRDFHKSNKINVYLANRGDYDGQAVIPWVMSKDGYDTSTMDISRWNAFDRYLQTFKEAGMFVEVWFFADDSGFGDLSQMEKNRLFRYAMARLSAYHHTLFVIALEWQDEWSSLSVRDSGHFIQEHNPWERLVSAHSQPVYGQIEFSTSQDNAAKIEQKNPFSDEEWMSFIASQAGNNSTAIQVNKMAVHMHTNHEKPHINEEFGVLRSDHDRQLRKNMWANFCGGAAGGGTGSDIKNLMRFIKRSRIPFYRMEPRNDLLIKPDQKMYCLAEKGHHYLVYSNKKEFEINTTGTNLHGYWYPIRNQEKYSGNKFKIQSGRRKFKAPNGGKEWVLWVTDGTNLAKKMCSVHCNF